MVNKTNQENEHVAIAKALNASISTKHSVEISSAIRNKNTSTVKIFLENVINLKEAVPFKRFNRDVGHKKNMAAGRFPQNAAKEFLKLVKSVEANAQVKGLDTSNLKIVKVISNKASVPFSGGRRRRGTKRTHLEMMVKEGEVVKKDSNKKEVKVDTGKKVSGGSKEPEKKVVENKETDNDTKVVNLKEETFVKKDEVKEVVKEDIEKVVKEEIEEKPKLEESTEKSKEEIKLETPEVKQ